MIFTNARDPADRRCPARAAGRRPICACHFRMHRFVPLRLKRSNPSSIMVFSLDPFKQVIHRVPNLVGV
jgi:hypothetical protein